MFSVPVDVPLPTVTDPLFTSPPFAMVSTPPFLTLSVPVFQVEPAPSTVTVRVPVPAPTKGLLPIIALLSLTVPPFSMMSTPDPVAPTTKLWPESVMVHVEPGPFTVTVPKPGTPLVLSPINCRTPMHY
jgi:hypothetical protein